MPSGMMGRMLVGSRSSKKKKSQANQAAQAPPKHTSPIVAWVVLIVIWFITIYPMATNTLGGTNGLIAAVVGFFILKAVFLNKLREILP